ncbi:MAG: LytTR family DNA-binding domain-containing protein [Bacteroidota bacterium]
MPTERPLRCLIVDDEPIAGERIARLLEEYSFIQLVGMCENGLEALSFVQNQKVDLMFVDIDMPGMDGMRLVQTIHPDDRPYIIFATAYDEFAVQAFDLFAIDYLLKPFSKERFSMCMQKTMFHIQHAGFSQPQQLSALFSSMEESPSSSDFSAHRLSVKLGKRTYFILIDQIEYICSAGNYLEVYAHAKVHVIRETMTHIEKILPSQFIRIHKSSLINLTYLQELIAMGEGDYSLKMQNDRCLRISDTYKKAVLERLKG